MDGGNGLAGHEAEDDVRGDVVSPYPLAELEVLVEHCAEGEGCGLFCLVSGRRDI